MDIIAYSLVISCLVRNIVVYYIKNGDTAKGREKVYQVWWLS